MFLTLFTKKRSEAFTKEFDEAFNTLKLVHEYKKTFVDETLTPSINQKKISELIDLRKVIEKKINQGTLMQDLQTYYLASPGAQKNMSMPVNHSLELQNIILQQKGLEQQNAVIDYYVEYFSKLSITQIILDGYKVGQRNDLATAITGAMPDSYQRRMFDQYYQLGKGLDACNDLVRKAQSEGSLDQEFLNLQIASLKNVAPKIHFLCTSEDESASRLSVLLGLVIAEFDGNMNHARLEKRLADEIRNLADDASSFEQQSAIIDRLSHDIEIKKMLYPSQEDQDLILRVLDLIKEARKQVKLPAQFLDLKALQVVAQLRAHLVVSRVKNPAWKYVEQAILALNQYETHIRDGKTSGETLLAVTSERVNDLKEVKNLHELIKWIQIKSPITSSLPKELMDILNYLKPPSNTINEVSDKFVGQSPVLMLPKRSLRELQMPSLPGESLWKMVLNAFNQANLRSTLKSLVKEYGNFPDEASVDTFVERMLMHLPNDMIVQLEALSSQEGLVTVDDVLTIFEPSVKYSPDMCLLLGFKETIDEDYVKTLHDMHARALFHQFQWLMEKTIDASKTCPQSADITILINKIASAIVPYLKRKSIIVNIYNVGQSKVQRAYEMLNLNDPLIERLSSNEYEPLPTIKTLKELTCELDNINLGVQIKITPR